MARENPSMIGASPLSSGAPVETLPYSQALKRDWDATVAEAKNATFLFFRDFMDYHAHRFSDCSLTFRKKGKTIALLPACRIGTSVYSHAGLTYGGLVLSPRITAADTLSIFQGMKEYFRALGMREMVYAPVPHIYHSIPAEEDLYALFLNGAVLTGRKISSAILLPATITMRRIRSHGVRKALRAGITTSRTDDFDSFWEILTDNLRENHNAGPVHSIAEIKMLASRFPDHITLHAAYLGGKMLAGSVLFRSRQVIHTQYIAASPEGKRLGAADLLLSRLIGESAGKSAYFDFGISTESGGRFLNEGLIYQKEGFGARAVCYDTYSLPLI